MTTKEQLADLAGTRIAAGGWGNPFNGFSSARISAILQFGANQEEMRQIANNLLPAQARALVVHYAVGQYPNVTRTTIVLCDRHRQSFYSLHPEACVHGEWRPVEECLHCAIDIPRQ